MFHENEKNYINAFKERNLKFNAKEHHKSCSTEHLAKLKDAFGKG